MQGMAAEGKKPVIGIVGGIGAGKSAVAREFVRLGAVLVDGDVIGHQLLGETDVKRQLRARWGAGIFRDDGSVDRRRLGEIVFADREQLSALNAILHPRIRSRMEQQIAAAQADPAVRAVALDAAVLFEAGWDDLCTHTLFVSAPREQRLARLASGRGWTEETMARREKSQISLDCKADRCDYILQNSSSESCLSERSRQLFNEILHATDRPY